MWPSSIKRCNAPREAAGNFSHKNLSSRSFGSDVSTTKFSERVDIKKFGFLNSEYSPWPFDDDFDLGFVFRDHVRGQNAAPENVRVNHRAATKDAAGVQHGVAAGFRAVAEQRAELAQAGVERRAVHLDENVAGEHFQIGNLHACAEVRLVAKDGVADVIEVRCLR